MDAIARACNCKGTCSQVRANERAQTELDGNGTIRERMDR
jgi:hypothetical protein